MKKAIIIFLLIHIMSAFAFAQSGWYSVASGTNSTLYSVDFPPSGTGNIGYAAGSSGAFLFTSNAGSNWMSRVSPTSNNLRSVFFTSAFTGWASGDAGTIIYTSNSGINWILQTTPVSDILYSIYFANQTTGWAVGSSGTILFTSNGGSNWTTQNSGSGDYLRSVYFTSASNGVAVGRNGRIIKTTNGGSNWFAISPFLSSTLYSVYFASPAAGWAAGFGSLYTTNGGYNWSLQQGGGIYFSVYFPVASTGWRTGFGGIIDVSTNSGVSWNPQASGTVLSLYSVFFTSISMGYIVGENGTILKTTDGGGLISETKSTENRIPAKYFLYQNYPNPFNPGTKIRFDVSSDSRLRGNDNVTLRIYDILGREISTLVKSQLSPGFYEFDWDGSNYPSGVYFYKLQSASFSETRRMVLLK